MASSLPVLMYHCVNRFPDPLSVSPERFEEHLRALTTAGFRTVSLAEAVGHLTGKAPLRGKVACITFDDGYLDNWINAFPLLRRHGHKAVVFAVAERIGRSGLRPNRDDVDAGRARPEELPDVDTPFETDELGFRARRAPFLSWDEARAMEASGVIDVSCHSLTHESVFRGPEWGGLIRPYHRKRVFDVVGSARIWGMPLFDTGPALATRAFLPSEELLALARAEVPQERTAAAEFFADDRRAAELEARMAAIPPERRGRLETDEEYHARVRLDLSQAKAIVERELGRPEHALCWPWGASTPEARGLARGLGFEALFGTTPGPNPPGAAWDARRFKARDRSGAWLRSRIELYSRPFLARLYALLRR